MLRVPHHAIRHRDNPILKIYEVFFSACVPNVLEEQEMENNSNTSVGPFCVYFCTSRIISQEAQHARTSHTINQIHKNVRIEHISLSLFSIHNFNLLEDRALHNLTQSAFPSQINPNFNVIIPSSLHGSAKLASWHKVV